MRRFYSLLCAAALFVCAAALPSCDREHTSEGGESGTVEIPFDDSLKSAITAWEQTEAYDVTFTSFVTMVEDGDEENASGTAMRFDVQRIPDEEGNLYHGSYVGVNSVLSFELTYEYYYYDGWVYRIYEEPTGITELNEYLRYESDEQTFLSGFYGIVPVIASDAEFASATAQRLEDGLVTVSVPVSDPDTLSALADYDMEMFAASNGIELSGMTLSAPVISYAVRDGALAGYIATFDITIPTDSGERVYSVERSGTVNAVADEVERFTLPDGAQEYPMIEE